MALVSDLEAIAHRNASQPVKAGRRLERMIQVARHYRWRQIARRGWKLARQKIRGAGRIGPIRPTSKVCIRKTDALTAAQVILPSYRHHISHGRSDVAGGRIVLLGEERQLGNPMQWSAWSDEDAPSHLWRFQLHYHEYLLAFLADRMTVACPLDVSDRSGGTPWGEVMSQPGRVTDGVAAAPTSVDPLRTIWSVVASWLDRHDPQQLRSDHDAWHPYCISRRLPVWIWLLSLKSPGEPLAERILVSMWQQAEYLHRNLEFDLGGNHLLENLTALALTGAFLESTGSQQWLTTAEHSLRAELDRQLLPHGEHYERAPMYHCQVLGNLLRVAIVCREVCPSLHALALDAARRMIAFLSSILHPDGEIPLLGDSGLGEAHPVSQIRQLAAVCQLPWAGGVETMQAIGPYRIFRGGPSSTSHFVLFDGGALGADELPAHAHCDLFGVEASFGGRRWLVDSGNFNYEDDSMRHYCRSSLAHNVLTIAETNTCDIWSKFRMGRRCRPLDLRDGHTGEFSWVLAGHAGFAHLQVPRIDRLVAVHKDGCVLVTDLAHTDGDPELVGYVHLAPEVGVVRRETDGGGDGFQLNLDGVSRRLLFVGCDRVEVQSGWHCRGFGDRRPAPVFVYRRSAGTGDPIGWWLETSDAESAPEMRIALMKTLWNAAREA